MEQPPIHKVIRSKRRTVGLEVTHDAGLIVRVPQKMPLEAVHDVVRQKLSWILGKQRFAREHYQPASPKVFAAGEKFLYFGTGYELCVAQGAPGPLGFNGKNFFLCAGSIPLAKQLFLDWYRKRAAEFFNARVCYYTGITGARYSNIRISNAAGRWGSCSSKGSLNFSWRLVMAPWEAADYVAVHEVVHLEALNHSARFWQKVKALKPDYPAAKQWLRQHHRSLGL